MSRWSRRSEEERARILAEQRESRKPRLPRAVVASMEQATNIYNEHLIPIMCPRCFEWRSFLHYDLREELDPFGAMRPFICGTCRECGSSMRRVMPTLQSDEGVLFAATAMLLVRDKKLTDHKRARKEG